MNVWLFKGNNANKKSSGGASWELLSLTLLYFLVEILINYILYDQLSTASDYFTIESLELWGKIITGLGISLIIVKAICAVSGKTKGVFKLYAATCLIGISASFFITNTLINWVVNDASEQQRNNALLISATKSTLVPHYDFSMASYPTDNLVMNGFDKLTYPFRSREKTTSLSYVTHKSAFVNISKKCAQISQERLGFSKNIDKAFFAINVLNTEVDETLYKSVIKDYYRCLYNDTDYRKNNSDGKAMPISGLQSMYQSYSQANEKYTTALKQLNKNRSLTLDLINTEWREEMNRSFGFETKLKPLMHWETFVRNADVRRYYLAKVDNKNAVYPYDEGYNQAFKDSIEDMLPESIIPLYRSQKPTSNSMPVSKDEETLRIEAGKKAYKAILLPIIGMAMSAFFLVTNIIILILSIFIRLNMPKATAVFFMVSILWMFGYPVIALNSSISERAYDSGKSYKTDWVYYHQRNISVIHDSLIASSATSKK
ncbi:MAG: hypothetical protein J6N72_11525 [Psychrobacter sp.]|nr:hypothetical protein [Psychrobacter sp.]